MSGHYLTKHRLAELAVKLSERDQAVLQSVASLRFVSGAQLRRLHFDGDGGQPAARARATRRALRKLVQLDVLARLPRVIGGVRAGSAGFVYHLDLAGQRLAMVHGWQPARRGRRPASPGRLFLAHCLQVAELHTQLIEADRAGRLELLALTAEPECHRRWPGLGSQGILKPDSFVRFGLGDYEYSFFVEVDRGSEGSRAILAKLRDYVAYEEAGVEQAECGVFPKVLWAVPDEARVEVIEDCIEQLAPSPRELFLALPFGALLTTLTTPDKAADWPPEQLPASVDL